MRDVLNGVESIHLTFHFSEFCLNEKLKGEIMAAILKD